MIIRVTEPSIVVLIGASGAGKSTFAKKHFKPTEILSSDYFRGLVSDDENSMSASEAAFDVLHYVAAKRLDAHRLVVVDATNVEASARAALLRLAREKHALVSAIVLDLPFEVVKARNALRPDRQFGDHVLRRHLGALRRSLRGLRDEGFRQVTVLRSAEEIEAATIERQRLWNDRRDDHGPFDIIGDVHGCADELRALLVRLGYTVGGTREAPEVTPPPGRRAIFLGDLVDRGPDSPGALYLAMHMHAAGHALVIPGNHEVKLKKKLDGREVRLTHGLEETMAQLGREPPELGPKVARWIDGLISHYVLDDGKLVVAHAGLSAELQGRASARVREFALYGDTTGETDEYGLPVRYPWAEEYRGKAAVVYGHTPVPEADWLNGTLCIDTGCVFGGKLTALRWPEKELVEVPAARTYYAPVRPLAAALTEAARGRDADVLDIDDVNGKRVVHVRHGPPVTVRPENAAAALEVMARFSVDPRWLVHLPPTMSPPRTAPAHDPCLERPEEALTYYADEGVSEVVCEEKHMGSRAILVVCRDEAAGARRFHLAGRGAVYTRTGRPFFDDAATTQALLARTGAALERAGLWEELGTDWVVLDAELMPWSAKAQGLLRGQYAAVGAAGRRALADARASLERAVARLPADAARDDGRSPQSSARLADPAGLLARFTERADAVDRYVAAYRRYCWPVHGLDDLALAPFHLLASEGRVHDDRDHVWHMTTLARLAEAEPRTFRATPFLVVDASDPAGRVQATAWWSALVDRGGEGMVVKPRNYLARGKHGLLQPAIKCRGPEYLRIIYGPEYRDARALERLRPRALGHKRALALRELTLGLEALHRFVAHEGLARVHECVFGVLALESEPVDPRL